MGWEYYKGQEHEGDHINRMYLHSYDFFIFFILTILFILSKKGNS